MLVNKKYIKKVYNKKNRSMKLTHRETESTSVLDSASHSFSDFKKQDFENIFHLVK